MFIDRLIAAVQAKGTPVICGLDPNLDLMADSFKSNYAINSAEDASKVVIDYNKMVIDQLHDLIPAVKPQIAYYEKLGLAGLKALQETINYAQEKGLLIILDAKRNDIGSTATAYAGAYLGNGLQADFESDCLTLIPYMGGDSMEPFFKFCDENQKGVFVCVKTSNPGSGDLQDLVTQDGRRIYEVVADMIATEAAKSVGENGYSSIGVVVGATYPEQASKLRAMLPHSYFLVPGLGTQGGDVSMVSNFFDDRGLGAVINYSRGFMYPKVEEGNTLEATIRSNAAKTIELVNSYLK